MTYKEVHMTKSAGNKKMYAAAILVFFFFTFLSLSNLFNQGQNPPKQPGNIDYDLFSKTWVYVPNSNMAKLDPQVYFSQQKDLPSSKFQPGFSSQNTGTAADPVYLQSPARSTYNSKNVSNPPQQVAPAGKVFR